jgi:hypothetical protein
MFSIAAHGNEAIPLLVHFADTSKNAHAREGAIYTLHLIGIDKKIAGRFSEYFKNKEARKALVELLKHEELRPLIAHLLIRDRWKSDIPVCMNILKYGSGEMSPIVNICISDLPEIPMHEIIPERFDDVMITVTDKHPDRFDLNADYSGQMTEALNKMKNKKHIHVDSLLLNQNLWEQHQKISRKEPFSVSSFLYGMTKCGYIENGSRLQYYIRNGELYICSSQVSKEIILNWWEQQTDSFKNGLSISEESFDRSPITITPDQFRNAKHIPVTESITVPTRNKQLQK